MTAARLRATSRLGVFATLLAIAAALGILTASAMLVAFAECGVLLLLALRLWLRATTRTLEVHRLHPSHAVEDESVRVRLRLNAGRLPIPGPIEAEDTIPAAPDPAVRFEAPALPAEWTIRVRCGRGRGTYRCGPVRVTVTDPFGFFRETRTLDVRTTLVVLPRPASPPPLPIEELGTWTGGSAHHQERAGASVLYHGTREYRRGDPLRHVHWRATARHRRWIVREFDEERAVETTIFLDLDARDLRGVGRATNLETCVRLAASEAAALCRAGHPVRLLADAAQPVRAGPGTGPRFLLTLLEILAHVRATGSTPFDALVAAHAEIVPPGGGALVLVPTRSVRPDGLRTAGAIWSARGVRAVAILLDDAEYMPVVPLDLPEADRLAAELALTGIRPHVMRPRADVEAAA